MAIATATITAIAAIVGTVAAVGSTVYAVTNQPKSPDFSALAQKPPPPLAEPKLPPPPASQTQKVDLNAREAAAKVLQAQKPKRTTTTLTSPLGAPQSAQNVSVSALGR